MQMENPIIIFDGVCNLCNGTVDFIVKRDKKKQFRFAALQSETGKKFLSDFQVKPNADSVVLIYQNKIFIESDAALEIARFLSFPWKFLAVFKYFPKKFRDRIYRWIARNRYRWFGKCETCRIPTPEEKELFLE